MNYIYYRCTHIDAKRMNTEQLKSNSLLNEIPVLMHSHHALAIVSTVYKLTLLLLKRVIILFSRQIIEL